MKPVDKIITDKELDDVWQNANFGSISRRDVIKDTLIKKATGFSAGRTAMCIVIELGLVSKRKMSLTTKGMQYLISVLLNDKNNDN